MTDIDLAIPEFLRRDLHPELNVPWKPRPAAQAARENFDRYKPLHDIARLRKEIADKERRLNTQMIKEEEVAILERAIPKLRAKLAAMEAAVEKV